MITVYERSFDWNEWFVLLGLFTLHILVWITPKIFDLLRGIAYYLYGITIITFFDHTLSVRPWDLYDVNDSSKYQFIDFLTYVMNGPISYFFIYVYVRFKIRGFGNLAYLLFASSFAVLVEYTGVQIGLYHYVKGYQIVWSFPIYFMMQTLEIILHHLLLRKK